MNVLEFTYCNTKEVGFISPFTKRSVNVSCVQTETALSGRHCILRQVQDVSSHYPGPYEKQPSWSESQSSRQLCRREGLGFQGYEPHIQDTFHSIFKQELKAAKEHGQ